jgi:membrane protein DedA with SNARE-associated domain/membrane-associated phospholipid phosphatase
MGDILHQIIAAVGANQHLAYLLVFLLSFSESLPLLGSIIPGTTVIVGISALVASGAVDIWWLLGSATLGAILGDGFSYWLGRHYHRAITTMWPLRNYPQLIAVGRAAVQKHGGKSIFIARFTPAIRAIVPMVAGILHMPAGRFYVVNIVSAVAWAVAHIVPAVIAGASLALAGAVGGRLVLLIVVLVGALWLILLVVRYAVRRGLPLLANGLLRLWHWARHHDNWVSREVLSLLDPSHHEIKGLLFLITLLVGGTWVLFGILEDVVAGEPLVRADQAVFNFMQGVRSVWGDRVMVALAELGDATVTGAVVLAVTLWLASRRAWRAIAYWLGAVAFALLFAALLKPILHLPRPTTAYGDAGAFAVANHAAVTATVYGFLALLVARELLPPARLALASVAALLVSLIAFSRLYLGAHFLSDVSAGLTFALAWVAGLGIVYLRHNPRAIGAHGLVGLAAAVFVGIGAFHGADSFDRDARRYAVRASPLHMAATEWWDEGWARLPARRIDLAGGLEEPITLQWAGSVELLKARLLAHGWREPPPWSIESALGWLQPGTPLDALPVLTRLHDGRPARLILVHPEAPNGGHPARLILRLWRSSVQIDGRPGSPTDRLWLGAVVEQRLYRVGSIVSFGLTARDENAPRPRLETDLTPVKVVHRAAAPDPWGWNGWVLLCHDPALALPMPEKSVEP